MPKTTPHGWTRESQALYFNKFLPAIRNKHYIVSHDIFSNIHVLDCLEKETDSCIRMAQLVRGVPQSQNISSILIVGSGSGKLGNVIRKLFPKVNLFDIDKNTTVIRRLQHKYRNDHRRKALCGKAYTLPFECNTIDVILCYSVFRYIQNVEDSINECVRVTKRGGTIIIGEADQNNMGTVEKIITHLQKTNIDFKTHTFPLVNLPHVTYFYYLIQEYEKNNVVTKMIDRERATTSGGIVKTAFRLAGSSLGNINTIYWQNI